MTEPNQNSPKDEKEKITIAKELDQVIELTTDLERRLETAAQGLSRINRDVDALAQWAIEFSKHFPELARIVEATATDAAIDEHTLKWVRRVAAGLRAAHQTQ